MFAPLNDDNDRMNTIRKVSAGASVQWLLESLSLLKRAPLALGGLGVLWSTCIWLLSAMAVLVPTLNGLLQLLLLLIGPLFMGGMLWAVREVERGRPVKPEYLLQGLRDGRCSQLWIALLPQLLAAIVLYGLMHLFLGEEGMQQAASVIAQLDELGRASTEPDPTQVQALVSSLPGAQIALWLLCVVFVLAITSLILFVLLPQVMFEPLSGWHALRRSVYANGRNLAAMAVCLLVLGITLSTIYFTALLLMLVLMALIGQAFALILMQMLLMAVLMPLLAGAMYSAWKQMLAQSTNTSPPAPQHIFEA